jgi:predicted nuclease of predicted toxin-antitoxin system
MIGYLVACERKSRTSTWVLARDIGIDEWTDDRVLEWASMEDRVVVSHDRNTMTNFIRQRIARGLPTTGLVIVDRWVAIGQAIDEILIAVHCGHPDEWIDRMIYIPLR